MTSSATVFLVRHGRTPLNAAGALRGRIDTPLDAVGRREARLLAGVFDGGSLAAVVSSRLTRAVETAAEAARLPVDVDDDLADRDYWRWAARRKRTRSPSSGRSRTCRASTRWTRSRRASPARSPAPRTVAASGAVVVVARDAVNRQLLASLVPSLGPAPGIAQRTACWNELQRDGDEWSAPVVDAGPADGRRPQPRGRQR